MLLEYIQNLGWNAPKMIFYFSFPLEKVTRFVLGLSKVEVNPFTLIASI